MLRVSRRSTLLAPKTLSDLRLNMFNTGTGEESPESAPPPGSVVLRYATQRAEPRYRFLTLFKEGHLRSPIDYYNLLVKGRKLTPKESLLANNQVFFLPELRRKAQVYVSHPPMLLAAPPEARSVTMLLPKEDPLLLHNQTGDREGGRNESGGGEIDHFEIRQLRAALRGLENANREVNDKRNTKLFNGRRHGALMSFDLCQDATTNMHGTIPVNLHFDRRFDNPSEALARLRELGTYLPCVYYDDQMYFEDDVLDAFSKGYVSISSAHPSNHVDCNAETHIRSIHQLWHMGFNLVLEGVHRDQVRTLRTQHGECEAIIVGQRLNFMYDKVAHVPHPTAGGGENGITYLTVRHTERIQGASSHAATASINEDFPSLQSKRNVAQVQKLLLGCEDFPQRQDADFEKLLYTRPAIDEPSISEMFQSLKASVETSARMARTRYSSGATGQLGRNRLNNNMATHVLIKDVQQLCAGVDVRKALLEAWSTPELHQMCSDAALRQASVDRQLRWALAKRVGAACGSYTDLVEHTLLDALVQSKSKAISHYRSVAKRQQAAVSTAAHFASLRLPTEEEQHEVQVNGQPTEYCNFKGMPFYDNLL